MLFRSRSRCCCWPGEAGTREVASFDKVTGSRYPAALRRLRQMVRAPPLGRAGPSRGAGSSRCPASRRASRWSGSGRSWRTSCSASDDVNCWGGGFIHISASDDANHRTPDLSDDDSDQAPRRHMANARTCPLREAVDAERKHFGPRLPLKHERDHASGRHPPRSRCSLGVGRSRGPAPPRPEPGRARAASSRARGEKEGSRQVGPRAAAPGGKVPPARRCARGRGSPDFGRGRRR